MKKLSYVIAFTALSLLSVNSFAQDVADATEATTTEAVAQEKVEIQLSELPEAVATAVGADFQGYTAEKAFKSSVDGQDIYTVQLSKDGEAIEVNFNAEGKVVQ